MAGGAASAVGVRKTAVARFCNNRKYLALIKHISNILQMSEFQSGKCVSFQKEAQSTLPARTKKAHSENFPVSSPIVKMQRSYEDLSEIGSGQLRKHLGEFWTSRR